MLLPQLLRGDSAQGRLSISLGPDGQVMSVFSGLYVHPPGATAAICSNSLPFSVFTACTSSYSQCVKALGQNLTDISANPGYVNEVMSPRITGS